MARGSVPCGINAQDPVVGQAYRRHDHKRRANLREKTGPVRVAGALSVREGNRYSSEGRGDRQEAPIGGKELPLRPLEPFLGSISMIIEFSGAEEFGFLVIADKKDMYFYGREALDGDWPVRGSVVAYQGKRARSRSTPSTTGVRP